MVAHESGLSHPPAALGQWAWRIVSEDSIHSIAPLSTPIHPFPESQNLVVVLIAQTISRRRRYKRPSASGSHSPPIPDRPSIDESTIRGNHHQKACRPPNERQLPGAYRAQRASADRLPKEIELHAIMLRNVEGG
jgi:hypothetical protein